jgi:putative transposase
MRSVAQKCHVTLRTVQKWVRHADGKRLDRVNWSDQPRGPKSAPARTPRAMEDHVLGARRELRSHSALGEFGADAIRRHLVGEGMESVPCARTIHRVLERRGALDGARRLRLPPPPPGWYLPEVAQRRVELDSFDFVGPLKIRRGPLVDIFNAVSLLGGLPGSWPMGQKTAQNALEALLEHWRAFGCPGYAQFDNDTVFQGPHQHPDTIGRVSRLCLSLGIVPVFVPPQETGFQASIENFNGRWQAKVWSRFEHQSLAELRERTARYLEALHARSATRIEAAPPRRAFPAHWRLDLQAKPRGRIVYLRRTSEDGSAAVLGQKLQVERSWLHRLVRAEVDLDADQITFYGLRRRDPSQHIFLRKLEHKVPHKPFQE